MNKKNHQARISQLLTSIERDLTDWIPLGVEDLKIQTRAYALFLWYQDYDDDLVPHIGVATDLLLEDVAKTQFHDPLEKYDILWCPQQSELSDASGRLLVDVCELVTEDVEECYELLALEHRLDDKIDSLSDEELCMEEFQALMPFREMMHRVGRSLQTCDWIKSLKPTENFAIVVSDFMGYFLDEDLPRSLGQPMIERLIRCDMLPENGF